MKKIHSYIMGIAAVMGAFLTGCSEFEPTGYQERAELPKVADLKANVSGLDVVLSWTLPAASDEITGVRITRNGNNESPVAILDGKPTTYTVKGQPMEEKYFYTVKVLYAGDLMSTGESVEAYVPSMKLPEISGLGASVSGRTVTLNWTLPQDKGVTGVRVIRNGDVDAAISLPAGTTTYKLKGQPMDQKLSYTVQTIYEKYYFSEGVSVETEVPYITPKMGFIMLAANVGQLPDDDERAAAAWFVQQPNSELIRVSEIASLDPDIYPVLWIMVDRVGLPVGWENLPADLIKKETIDALKAYSANGGNLYLSNMATQLTVPLGIVPADMAPTAFGSGDGGTGTDVWTINPYLGWDFKDGADQGFYDRTEHAIFKDLTMENLNGYDYKSLPLIGPGQREDHNCLWDCNLYGKGSYPDVIRNFEVTTNSLVLATWGHVRDHCVAGLVEFYANTDHGRCIANGFAAYEWNQNSGANPYQHNVEQLTSNILNYLK